MLQIKAFLMQEVEGMVNKSIHSVRSFVQEYMCKQLDGAKWRLAEYCNSYDAKMSAAMDVGMRDGEERQHALRQASKQAAAIKDIGMRLEALAEEVCGADTDEEGDCSPEESGCSVAASWVMESIPDGHKDAPMEANEVQDSVVHEVPPRENQLEPKANPEGTEETVEPAAVDADVTPKGEERADGRLGEESFMSATEELPAFVSVQPIPKATRGSRGLTFLSNCRSVCTTSRWQRLGILLWVPFPSPTPLAKCRLI